MTLFIRLLFCLAIAGILLYKMIDNINELTELRLAIPMLSKELLEIREHNLELQYAIAHFESADNLMKIANRPEFGHLRFPSVDEIIVLPEHDPKTDNTIVNYQQNLTLNLSC